MEEYKKEPLWQKVFVLGQKIDALTKNFPECNTLSRFLRDRAAEMPVTIAMGLIDGKTADYAQDLKAAYLQAHDTEYLLFFLFVFNYLPYNDVSQLTKQVYEVKRLILDTLNKDADTWKK
jgi:four helix bundle protein